MPKRTAARAGKQLSRHKISQTSNASKEDSIPTGSNANVQKLKLSQLDPYRQYQINTSSLYPDIQSVSVTGEQFEKCKDKVINLMNLGDRVAKDEYRRQFMSLMKADRISLQTGNDSGDRKAAKQWDKFCQESLKFLLLRDRLHNKPVAAAPVGHPHDSFPFRNATSADEKPSCFSFTEGEIERLGKITYAAYRSTTEEGSSKGGGVLFMSSVFPRDLPVLLDMSQWVHKGAIHAVSNNVMQNWMAALRKEYGADLQAARRAYQVLLHEVQDIDEEQLRNQAHTGITKDSQNKYMLFCDQCFQLAALWQIIYNKPIPIRLDVHSIEKRTMLPDFEKQWQDARGFDDTSLLA